MEAGPCPGQVDLNDQLNVRRNHSMRARRRWEALVWVVARPLARIPWLMRRRNSRAACLS
jgi:hypothetical protein